MGSKRIRDGSQGCSVDQCEGKHYAKGYCRKHWTRNHQTGSPLPKKKPDCDCGLPAMSRGMCKKHYQLWWHANRVIRPVDPTANNYKGDSISYEGAHYRVVGARGRARIYLCTECQQPAKDWALKHDADKVTDNKGRMYSLDVMDYQPMCGDCHSAYDAKHGNRKYKTGAYAAVNKEEA